MELDRITKQNVAVTPRMGRVSCNAIFSEPTKFDTCHAPHGACELKLKSACETLDRKCHAPHGACELKSDKKSAVVRRDDVTPRMGRVS